MLVNEVWAGAIPRCGGPDTSVVDELEMAWLTGGSPAELGRLELITHWRRPELAHGETAQ